MNILVTGANGFIGHHVCDYLKEKGHYIIGLDLGATPKSEIDEYLTCDMKSEKIGGIFHEIKAKKVDALVHLAADMRKEPYATDVIGTNCVGVQRLLELCEAEKVPVFVQLSSLPVIGEPIEHPITEKHPLKPPTVYHATKITQELLANYAFYTFGLRTISFRICSPVGIGVNPKTIFPVFVNKAVNHEDLVLQGKGTRKQTYIHVLDIAQAIEKAILSKAQGIYNLASYNLLSNYELAEKCIAVTNSKAKILFSEQEDAMDDYCWDTSIEKAKTDMGYEPKIGIEQAILELAQNIKEKNDF